MVYEKNLQETIIKARNPQNSANEENLIELVKSYDNSDYNIDVYLQDYITERERELNAIHIIYNETVNKKEPQIAHLEAAKIASALVNTRVVFVLTLKVLPEVEEEKYSKYVEEKRKNLYEEKKRNSWYNRNVMVGSIGKLWTAYKKFYEYNNYRVS